MRYREVYEIILIALKKFKLSFPVGENMLNSIFDSHVEDISIRVLKKRDYERFTTTATKEYVFTKTNLPSQHGGVFRVQLGDGSPVPFIDKPSAPVLDDDDIANIGYYIDTDVDTGAVTGATSANPIVVTSTAHGLATGDYVIISEIAGLLSAAGALSEVNGIRHLITKIDANSFSIPIDGSGYGVAYSSGGKWQQDSKKLVFTKTPDAGETLDIHYYALPEARASLVSRIDMPEPLIIAAIHYTISDIIDLDGHFQVGSGHRGLASRKETEYFNTSRTNRPYPYRPEPPMTAFNT